MVGFWGTSPSNNIEELIGKNNVGGIILFHYNIDTEKQLVSLIQKLQNEAISSGAGIPLFISVDQEGGVVSRIKFADIEELTSQPDIETIEQAYSVGKTRGEELVRLGINMNFSPVLDYAENEGSFLYDRTFHGSRDEVSSLAASMINGYFDSNIIAVAKHFPGHPDNTTDSHNFLPIVNCNRNELEDFTSQFGDTFSNSNLRAVMSAHVLYPNIDSENPASLSRIMLTDFLRNELNFEGLLITDDLEMGATTNDLTPAESAVKAVAAGNDVLMFASTFDSQVEAYESILSAVHEGSISESRIDESVLKILKLKNLFITARY